MEWASNFFSKLLSDLAQIDSQLVMLAVIVIACVMMLDAFSATAKKKIKEVGFDKGTEAVSIDGSKTLPVREYISEIQGLAGKPDALLVEGGNIIPVERKPLAKKVRDRYVAQLLVYMRLVEEFEGKKPPYGYLILGSKCRQVKIYNSDEKQAWLTGVLDEMRAVLGGRAATPTPLPPKCAGCEVRKDCAYRAEIKKTPGGSGFTGPQTE